MSYATVVCVSSFLAAPCSSSNSIPNREPCLRDMFSWVQVAVLSVLAVHVLADNGCDIVDDHASMIHGCDIVDDHASMIQNFQMDRTMQGKQAGAETVGFAVALPIDAAVAAPVPAPLAPDVANKTSKTDPGGQPAAAKGTICSLDANSMWGTHLEDLHLNTTVKSAFRLVMREISRALNPDCTHVTITASLFSKQKLRGRAVKTTELEEPPPYEGQRGCGIFVLSSWQAQVLTKASNAKSFRGWKLVPFPTDAFLVQIESTHQSNELQRFFNLVKIGVQLYLPETVESAKLVGTPPADITTLEHPKHANGSLMREWSETVKRAKSRHELSPVFADIERVEDHFGNHFEKWYLQRHVRMADIMCMQWNRTEAVQSFARIWFWYTAHFTMRPQLTWNAALRDVKNCSDGQGLKVNYLQYIHPTIKLVEIPAAQNSTGEIENSLHGE
eukprot:Skav225734  [mRNA]  locus=scaffold611:131303:134490:+ [translate_table: standard]